MGSFCSRVCWLFIFDHININNFWLHIVMKSQEFVKFTLLKRKWKIRIFYLSLEICILVKYLHYWHISALSLKYFSLFQQNICYLQQTHSSCFLLHHPPHQTKNVGLNQKIIQIQFPSQSPSLFSILIPIFIPCSIMVSILTKSLYQFHSPSQ